MVVNSFVFLVVYPFLFTLYWIIPSRAIAMRKWYLIAVSYLVYMSFFAAHALVLFYVTIVTYWAGRCLEKITKHRKKTNALFIVAALLPLTVFKYFNFLAQTVSQSFSCIGLQLHIDGLNWAIPIGLSFFSLQAISYQVDVYYQRIKAEKSFTDYMLFVSFFPQIVSGPISKASELLPQIKSRLTFKYELAKHGLKLILWGLFMKVAIADRAGLVVNYVYDHYVMSTGSECLLAALLYSIQIYADFAGYSLMAIGIANTLGYQIINNFNRPYFSLSVTDFWRRWHISLSRWLKDYIYIPLGGSRCSKSRNYLNIIITFLVSGIWHGANWTFIFWGLIHGVSQVIEKALGCQKVTSKNRVYRAWRIVLTFTIVTIAWIFFRMPTLQDGLNIVTKMATDISSPVRISDDTNLLYLMLTLPVLLIYDFWREFWPSRFSFLNSHVVQWFLCVVLVLMILSVGVLDSGQFIYASF